jgi:protein-S-isoprenylcysteine O-methyltransferase Ste14
MANSNARRRDKECKASKWAWPVFALRIRWFYVFRLLNEEKVLRPAGPGYSEYCLRIPFRLVPFVW